MKRPLFDCAQFVPHHLLFTGIYWRLLAQCEKTNTVSD